MSHPYVETEILIRLLTGDDLRKQARAVALFQQVERGQLIVAAPETVISDSVYVLSSRRLYNRPRTEIAAMLTALVRLPGFHVQNRRSVLAALSLYGTTRRLDFGNALIVASARQAGSQVVYSYDSDFDAFPDISRQEP